MTCRFCGLPSTSGIHPSCLSLLQGDSSTRDRQAEYDRWRREQFPGSHRSVAGKPKTRKPSEAEIDNRATGQYGSLKPGAEMKMALATEFSIRRKSRRWKTV